ncbi:hypothetical protein [Rhodophyticola sp.]|uniref:hypothetical protein n=1 Tax=Rhodophyticola sp. TaxID=2680032 RepID=UPI003D27554A
MPGGFGNDTLIGSAANEAFITGEGNDVVNGGGGFDRIRYDRFGVDGGMTIDLDAGTASGSWFGGPLPTA